MNGEKDPENALSLEGLLPEQAGLLRTMRDKMLGWRFVGCAIDIDGDYYWQRGSVVRAVGEAQHFKSAAKAELEIERRVRSGDDDERVLSVVGVYRKGDDWDTGPAVPPLALVRQ
jgi:hypothetical protein